MSNGFVHSVMVPRIYKATANIVRRVREDGASLKTLIYEKNHPVSVNKTNDFTKHIEIKVEKIPVFLQQFYYISIIIS